MFHLNFRPRATTRSCDRFDSPCSPCRILLVVLSWKAAPKRLPHPSHLFAIVAELADAHGSGPCTRKGVGVRVPSMAPVAFRSFGKLRISPAGSRSGAERKPGNFDDRLRSQRTERLPSTLE